MMPRKVPSNRFSISPDERYSKLIQDYTTVLKDKSGLESENAILKYQIDNQKSNINKLNSDFNLLKSELEANSILKINSENDLERHKHELKKMEDAYTATIIQNDASRKQLEEKMVELTQDLIKKDENLIKLNDDLRALECKNIKYKEKIEMALTVIRTANWDHLKKKFCDKEIQTCSNNLSNFTDEEFIKHYEVQMLSELFFKENPFTDGDE